MRPYLSASIRLAENAPPIQPAIMPEIATEMANIEEI